MCIHVCWLEFVLQFERKYVVEADRVASQAAALPEAIYLPEATPNVPPRSEFGQSPNVVFFGIV